MATSTPDYIKEMRERITTAQARPGYHPYWASSPVVPDEPLRAISFRRRGAGQWIGPWNTATRDLDDAITEARQHLGAPKSATVSVRPTVPRAETYRGAKDTLMGMLLSVPPGHRAAGEAIDQIREALLVVYEAEKNGAPLSGLRVDLPFAVEVDRHKLGRPQTIKTITWGDHDGDWPTWHRCSGKSK